MIITSRIADWSAAVQTAELDVLGQQDAAAFWLERAESRRKKTDADAEDVAVLAHELGGLAWLVAGSYSAWSVCNSGLSSSIALSQASHGNVLNLVEKATGQVVPLSQTVFAPFVFIPMVLVVVVMTAIFIKIHPRPDQAGVFRDASTETTRGADPHSREADTASFASRVEPSMLGTLLLLALGVGYLVMLWHDKRFELDINATILIFLLVGLGLQRTPIAGVQIRS